MHKQHVKYTIVKTHCIACLLVLKTENNSMNNKHDIQKLYKFFSLKHYYQYLSFLSLSYLSVSIKDTHPEYMDPQ